MRKSVGVNELLQGSGFRWITLKVNLLQNESQEYRGHLVTHMESDATHRRSSTDLLQIDKLGFVDLAMCEAAIEGCPVDNHGIFHVVSLDAESQFIN